MRFKFLLSILAFSLFAFTNASAENAQEGYFVTTPFPDSVYKIKTLEELERMPPERAQEYLEDLQELIVDLELIYKDHFTRTKSKPKSDFSQFKLIIESLINKADAAYSAGQISSVQVGVINSAQGPRRFCGLGLIPVHINNRSWACQVNKPRQKTPCQPGTIAINQIADGSFKCVSNASFNKMEARDKWGMRAWNIRASNNPALAAANKNYRAVKTSFDNGLRPLSALNQQPNRRPANRTVPAKQLNRNKTTDENSTSEDTAGARPRDASDLARAAQGFSRIAGVTDEDLNRFKDDETGVLDRDDSPTLEPGGSEVDAEREAIVNRCVKPEARIAEECPQEKIESGRRALYGAKTNFCVFAGNFSSYKGNQPAPGQCRPVFEFCYGKASCRDENYNKTATPDVACGANQVICNPYIFSLQKDTGRPYCVKPDENATQSCIDATTRAKREGTHQPLVDRLWKHALYKHAMTKHGQNFAEWFKGFNDFANQVNTMCEGSDQNRKDAFCLECNLIRRRLIWMNAKPFANKPEGQCKQIFDLGRVPAAIQSGASPAAVPAGGAAAGQ